MQSRADFLRASRGQAPNNAHLNGTPVQRPAEFGERRLLTDQDLRVVERFTRVDDNTIDYELTVEDPVVLTRRLP